MTVASDMTILIADGDAGSRALVARHLRRAGFAVVEAEDGEAALAAARAERPAAVLTEVSLAGVSGYAVCRELRDRYGEWLPIIFVSGERTEPIDRVSGLLLGADDYIVKPFDGDELVVRVRRAVERAGSFARTTLGPTAVDGEGEALTPREREVLELLTQGLNQAQIAEELVISKRTVGTHIQRMLAKLGVHNRAQAVALALRQELVTPEGARR